MKVAVSLFLAFNFYQVNGKEQSCSSECFKPDYSRHCNFWNNGVDKRIPKTVYQYDPKTQKCKNLSCKGQLYDYFSSESECLETCGNCGRILKQYKFDDACLKLFRMDFAYGSSPRATEARVYYFNVTKGECSEKINDGRWYVGTGLGLPTLEECEERCPRIK